MGDNTSPISVILVSSGSRGNKLLFRYPFQRSPEHPAARTSRPRSRYAVTSSSEHADDQDGDSSEPCPPSDERLVAGFSDVILATILATKSEMCGQKFELKIDNVRFVGHPTLLQHALGQVSKTDPSPKREAPTMILFNVVFALRFAFRLWISCRAFSWRSAPTRCELRCLSVFHIVHPRDNAPGPRASCGRLVFGVDGPPRVRSGVGERSCRLRPGHCARRTFVIVRP